MSTCTEYSSCDEKNKLKLKEDETPYICGDRVNPLKGKECKGSKQCGEEMREKGAITVEASMLLPIVIVICFSFMLFFQLIMVQTRLQSALEEVASEMALAGYVEELLPEQNLAGDGMIQDIISRAAEGAVQMGIGTAYVQLSIPDKIDESWFDETMIKGGSKGITYILSPVALETGLIDLRAYYEFHFPGISIFDVEFCQRTVRKKWNGLPNISLNSDNNEAGNNSGDAGNNPESSEHKEKQVYVTKDGKVYHLYKDCRVLKRDVKTGSLSQMQEKRNNSGGKYYACEACVRGTANIIVYYTLDGDRYHNSISCGSLIRYISKLGISQVGGKPPCKFCTGRSIAGDEDTLEE